MAVRRWASVGPYYAMFPYDFAERTIKAFCPPGGSVMDPFAGRGTSIFAAAVNGYKAWGSELGALGSVYCQTKLAPPAAEDVLARLDEIGSQAGGFLSDARTMPEFFRHCYSDGVLSFLLAARSGLDWERDAVDCGLMAMILVDLHGDRLHSLSNQMRRTKSMSPDYSVAWWKAKSMPPPEIDPVTVMRDKILWRYRSGPPIFGHNATVVHGDCREVLVGLEVMTKEKIKPFDMVLTSPPYAGVIDYDYEQWLRLWLLGEAEASKRRNGERFTNAASYEGLLRDTFSGLKRCSKEDAVIYVRTDARKTSCDVTREVLKMTFPEHNLREINRPFGRATQGGLYADKNDKARSKPGEIDLAMVPRGEPLSMEAELLFAE